MKLSFILIKVLLSSPPKGRSKVPIAIISILWVTLRPFLFKSNSLKICLNYKAYFGTCKYWKHLSTQEFLGSKYSPLCTHLVVATNFPLIIRINHQSQLNLCLKDSKWPGGRLKFLSQLLCPLMEVCCLSVCSFGPSLPPSTHQLGSNQKNRNTQVVQKEVYYREFTSKLLGWL